MTFLRERRAKKSNCKNISKIPEKVSLVTLILDFHKLSLLPLWSDPDVNLKNKNWC